MFRSPSLVSNLVCLLHPPPFFSHVPTLFFSKQKGPFSDEEFSCRQMVASSLDVPNWMHQAPLHWSPLDPVGPNVQKPFPLNFEALLCCLLRNLSFSDVWFGQRFFSRLFCYLVLFKIVITRGGPGSNSFPFTLDCNQSQTGGCSQLHWTDVF